MPKAKYHNVVYLDLPLTLRSNVGCYHEYQHGKLIRTDLGFLEENLRQGHEVNIRPATDDEFWEVTGHYPEFFK